jgi:ADP-heptose:LPS heptosyltransferase
MTAKQPNSNNLKILTINFGGIGDEILFLPTLESIRTIYPNAHVTLLLEPRSKSIEQITNLVDKTLTFDIKKRPLLPSDLYQLLSLIRSGKFDLVISSGSSPQVAALLFFSGIPKRIGYGSNWLARILLSSPVALDRNQYAAAMYQDLAKGIGATKLPAASCIPKAVLNADSTRRMRDFLKSQGTASDTLQRIVIHPGTSILAVQKGIIKTWDTSNWAHLINRLGQEDNIQIVLAGGPDDADIIADLKQRLVAEPNLIFGQTRSLADLAALIDQSDLLICVDSAPMHLAVALNKPLVALFGPTDETKLLPEHPKFKALRDKPMSEFPRRLEDGLGVRLQPDIVFQSVMDLLREWKARGSHSPQLR